MGTKHIQPRTNGASLKKLTSQQVIFVGELLADDEFCPTRAAKKAGYSHPSQAANKLLQKREIRAALGKAQRERCERIGLQADDVLEYLRTALYFNPLHHFRPTEDGKWLIKDLDALPEEIGRLIDGMEVKVIENDDGSTTSHFKVSFVSKATALTLAMKHVGVEKHEVKHTLDWDALYANRSEDGLKLIEAEIARGGDG